MTASVLTVQENAQVVPGPALLRHAADPLDHAAHRRTHGPVPTLGLTDLEALVAGAGVRGRGGAGFPFVRKLRAAAERSGPLRRPVVVVNASEGEPASAKDAALAAAAPHLVLDGAAVAAAALGAREVHVVLPGDRPRARALLGAAIRERTDPRLRWRTHVADSRFVSGQARAVIELMSGRPGLPVTAWSPEAYAGHRDRPTLLSNAETWAHVGLLALEGLGPVLDQGTADEPGTTLLTVHAPDQAVRVVEVEHGTPLRAVLPPSAHGGPVLLGGFHGTWASWDTVASSTVSAAALREQGISLGAGLVLALGARGCAAETTAEIVGYLAGQSAGRCGPCFNGLPALARAAAGLRDGLPGARAELERISGVVAGRGACAHPDGTVRLVASLLRALPDEVEAHERLGCSTRTGREAAS